MIKLAIRQDDQAAVVRAYFSSLDDKQREEVATLDLSLARACPNLFNAWKDALSNALKQLLEEDGYRVLGMSEIKPHEKQ